MSTDTFEQGQESSGRGIDGTASLWSRRWLLLAVLVVGTAAGYGVTSLLQPRYTAKASFLPQQAGNGAAGAFAALGPLVGLAPQVQRNSAEQFVALMQSVTMSDRIIDRFDLRKAYESAYVSDAREQLAGSVRQWVGRKDGLVYIEVDDGDPQRAADMANAYIDELQAMVSKLAIGEAKQRRVFFETQLKLTRDHLTKAQIELQDSGFTQGALKAEPKAAADGYAKLKADVMAAEVRVQTMRSYLNESAPDMRQAVAVLEALRSQLSRSEAAVSGGANSKSSDYITKYREFKYQENLFELFSRQYELARVDESREGLPVQVIDVAARPEKPTGPRKLRISLSTGVAAAILVALAVMLRRRRPTPTDGQPT